MTRRAEKMKRAAGRASGLINAPRAGSVRERLSVERPGA